MTTPLSSLAEGGRRFVLWRRIEKARRLLSPKMGRALLERAARHDATDYKAGNREVATIVEELRIARESGAYNEELIYAQADNASRLCRKMSLERCIDFAARAHVPPCPTAEGPGQLARFRCEKWWRRQLRASRTRRCETVRRRLGFIRKGGESKVSDDMVSYYRIRRLRNREFLERHVTVDEMGFELSLAKASAATVANPAIRRGEMMTRLRGFAEVAEELGHLCDFLTLTVPSAYHAELADGGHNERFEGFSPRDAQNWLRKMWARVRSALHRRKLYVYGFRTAEPHHDGTPHWHACFFGTAEALEHLGALVREKWLSEYSGEPGAATRRVSIKRLAAGSATGYVSKYVSKNIDGAGSIGDDVDDESGLRVGVGIDRTLAWAACYGIRQFQQIGRPPVGLWRELRRLRQPHARVAVEVARACADRGDWRGFVLAVGGIDGGRTDVVELERYIPDGVNAYGEPRSPTVVGIRDSTGTVTITRPHTWSAPRRPSSSFPPPALFLPWTRGNYCPGPENDPKGWTNPQETSQAPPLSDNR